MRLYFLSNLTYNIFYLKCYLCIMCPTHPSSSFPPYSLVLETSRKPTVDKVEPEAISNLCLAC